MQGARALVDVLSRAASSTSSACPATPAWRSTTRCTTCATAITHVMTRDERSASFMADVYARVSGRLGVCEGPSGGGATYIVPGVAEAHGSAIPLLCLTSDTPVGQHGRGVLTELDQETLFRPVTKWNTRINSAADDGRDDAAGDPDGDHRPARRRPPLVADRHARRRDAGRIGLRRARVRAARRRCGPGPIRRWSQRAADAHRGGRAAGDRGRRRRADLRRLGRADRASPRRSTSRWRRRSTARAASPRRAASRSGSSAATARGRTRTRPSPTPIW